MISILGSVAAIAPLWLIWPIIVGIVAYWYLKRPYDYWERLGIPYIPGVPLFGSILSAFFKGFHEVELERYKEKGRIYGSYEGTMRVLNVGEPDILRDIFVKDFSVFSGRRSFSVGTPVTDNMIGNLHGEDWKRVRSVMSPAFSTGKLKRMISIFLDSANTLIANFKAEAERKKPIDVKRLFGAFTMDVIASSAFATKIDTHNDPENPFVVAAKGAFTNPFPWRFILFFAFPSLMRFFRISLFSPGPVNFFAKVTNQLVEERKRTKQRRNDYLQLLLDAVEREEKETEDLTESEESKEMGHEEGNEKIFTSYQSSKALSTTEMVANSVIFFLAGYDTTASTVTFIVYELAVNPLMQDRAIKEIDEAIKQKGGLNYEAVCEMKYLDNIISECLRKYPPSIRTERLAEKDYEVKDGRGINITISKGTVVAAPVYAIHHDPQNYPDPEKFDPDRFTHEQKSSRHLYTYLPFGAGPRNCVAMRFALMEVKVCLASVLSHFRFKTSSETQIPMQIYSGQGVLQPKEVLLDVEIRSDPKM